MFETDPDVVGVDFSGAKRAGQHIWIAECSSSGELLTVDECYAAESKVGNERDQVLRKLCDAISTAESCTVGLDFPFGVPKAVTEANDWDSFVGEFDYCSPDQFHEECKNAAEQRCGTSYLQRETEDEVVGGLCSYGWRIRNQTFYGIQSVLGEILGDVAVPPMHASGDVNVVETYPAATFEHIGAERTGYKGQRQSSHDTRRTNLETLIQGGDERNRVEFTSHKLRDYALCDDNALDAVACAFAAARAKDTGFEKCNNHYNPAEGYIYV